MPDDNPGIRRDLIGDPLQHLLFDVGCGEERSDLLQVPDEPALGHLCEGPGAQQSLQHRLDCRPSGRASAAGGGFVPSAGGRGGAPGGGLGLGLGRQAASAGVTVMTQPGLSFWS